MVTTAGTTDRHCCQPFSRGTLLVLVMTGLLFGAHWFVYYSIELRVTNTSYKIILNCAHYALWVLLPVVGWVAESWLGRYQTIVIGLIMSMITVVLMQVAFMALQFPILAMILILAALVIGTIGSGSLYTIMLPFTLDQMIGASAEELSAVVQWYTGGSLISEY